MFFKTMLFTLLSAALCFSALVTSLTIKETAGVARINEDVTMGVPLPENGAYTDATLFTLRDGSNNIIPCEIKSVCTWFKNQNDIRWLQLNFPFSMAASETKTVTLNSETSPYALSSNLTVQDQGTYFEVNTGKIRFYVRKARFNLIDQAWVDESGNGNYSDANKVVATHERGLVHVMNNTELLSSNDTGSMVTVERQGPGVVTLKAVGKLLTAAGAGPFNHVTRIYAFNNSQTVKIQTAIEYRETDITKFVAVQGWHAEIPLNLGASMTAVLGKPGGFEQAALSAGQDLYCMVQRPSANSSIGTAIQGLIGGAVTGSFDPKALKPRDIGWVALSDGAKGCLVGMKYFWQMVPASVEAFGNGTLLVGMYSRRTQTIPTSFYAGCGRSAELRFTFFNTATPAQLRSRAAGATDRLFAVASPYWYTRRTNSAVHMVETNSSIYSATNLPYYTFMEGRLNSIFSTILGADDNWLGYDSYGFLEWGDNPHYNQGGAFPWNILWNGNYYGMDFFALEHYFHTGDLRFLNWGLAHTQHVQDVHQVHMGDADPNTGSSRYCPPANHIATEDGNPTIGNMSHHKVEGNFLDYYLTGNDYGLQIALEGAKYSFGQGFSLITNNPQCTADNVFTYIRRWSHQMYSVCWAYEFTHDSTYYKLIWQNWEMMKRNIANNCTMGQPFMVGLAMEAVVKMYYILTPSYRTNTGAIKPDSVNYYLHQWCATVASQPTGTGSQEINSNVTIGYAFLGQVYGQNFYDVAGAKAQILPATMNNLHKDFAQQARNFEMAMYYLAIPDSITCGQVNAEQGRLSRAPQAQLVLTANPQPFNPVAIVNLSGAALGRGPVSLKVFTPSGALVQDLSKALLAGGWSVRWDASGLPAGVYVLKCEAGRSSAVKRLTLIK